ncbi:MAG: hypothetical protein OXI40_14070 [Chloroflexota bacterium]|nr:hypothetical protein [Chloroflexota bacterium]
MEFANEQSGYQHIQASDVLLAIVSAAGEQIDLAQLQKVAFLISEEFDQDLVNFYEFRKYNYGPFCQAIYGDLEMLQGLGFIHIKEGNQKTYSVAHQLGLENFNLPVRLKQYIMETVTWVTGMSFNELLNAIYYLFPEYQENSIFNYSEEDAMVESFERALRDDQEGKTFDAKTRLEELSRSHA